MNARKITLCMAILIFCVIAAGEANKNLDYTHYANQEKEQALPSFGYLTFVLVCIGLLIVISVWSLKKIMNGRGLGASKNMKVKESLYLGNKTFLHAVEMAGRVVVIAVSPQHIARVMEVAASELAGKLEEPGKSGFSDTLATMIAGLGGKKQDKVDSGDCKK